MSQCAPGGGRSRRSCRWSPISHRSGGVVERAACRVSQDAAPVSRFGVSARAPGRLGARRWYWPCSRPPSLRRRLLSMSALVGPTQPPTPILAAEARWPLGLWPKKFMYGSCGWPWAAWGVADRFGYWGSLSSVLRGSLLLRASHRTHVRHVAGQASWVGPNAVLSPLWTQASEGGNLEAAGLAHLAPGSVPTPSRVPSELRPAKGATKGRPC